MSTTVAETTAIPTVVRAFPNGDGLHVTGPSELSVESDCPQCGYKVAASSDHDVQAAHQRIQELEARIKFLTIRAAETGMRLIYSSYAVQLSYVPYGSN